MEMNIANVANVVAELEAKLTAVNEEIAAKRAFEKELAKAHAAAIKEDAARERAAKRAFEKELAKAHAAAIKEDAARERAAVKAEAARILAEARQAVLALRSKRQAVLAVQEL
jgi:flagellar biosynthesis/type III secretory pathway protein FliH